MSHSSFSSSESRSSGEHSPTSPLVERTLVDRAVELAKELLLHANRLQTPSERRQQAELDRLLQSPDDKNTVVQLTDQAFRCRAASRTAEHLTHILDVQGIPRFFTALDKALLRGFRTFGAWLPGVAVPLVKNHLRHETATVVLPAETDLLIEHLRARQAEGVRMNLNFLGEALLGEEEAEQRLQKYLTALQLPEVEVVSVKISTLYSQIAPHAREHTLRVLGDRLELLYREAAHLKFTRADGTTVPKFIYLDMEEYRDLELTAEAFMRTLDRPGLKNASGGIALQAYIPDSARMQRRIYDWARRRAAAGGAPVTVRIVKGANLEAERVEASLRGWPQAPYLTKLETDANYKRMLIEALRPENLAAARVGVASHNLLDLALAIVLTDEAGGFDRVHFEMLEGMAHSVRRALLAQQQPMLLYAPACKQDEFLNAIGYLMRRLDENTGPENFLRHAFKLVPDSDDWKLLEQGFRAACASAASDEPRRRQNRLTERFDAPIAARPWNQLDGEPDTDFSLPANSTWAEQLVDSLAMFKPTETTGPIPLVIDGEAVTHDAPRLRDCLDPSRPGAVVARYVEADGDDVERAVAVAKNDPDGWRTMSVDRRNEILGHAAVELRRARGRLMQAALLDGGKLLTESDPEVSEAIDFVEFYRASTRWWYEHPEVVAAPRGVVVVAPPWNFPIAIPCGGIVAALAAGNTVIMKPASDTVLVAWELCNCLWRGEVSRRVLQFLPCSGAGAGSRLAAHDDVDTVVLTGGTSTGEKMLAAKPTLRLLAETGGKNATIITALSDRELAIKHVVHSAFSHSGQKCSATSLLLLEAEIYDDPAFKHVLCDAVRSLRVGPADDLAARVGPLIRPPSGDLEVALKTLEPGETWAVMPRQIGDNPRLWSPGVKYGVTPGSFTHRTELFGPVLGVMRFETLDEAIQIVNATGYGLTSGLHSLDDREQRKWRESIRAGNLYVNRGTTGAIVLRQPFGGLGLSSMGPGMKAGGPNYVAQLLRFDDSRASSVSPLPLIPPLAELSAALDTVGGELLGGADRVRLERALESYSHWWREEFSREHDHFQLLGQDNVRRYLPLSEVRIRVTPDDSPFEVVARAAAARATGARVIVSYPDDCELATVQLLDDLTPAWAAGIEFEAESDSDLVEWLQRLGPHPDERLRYARPDRVPVEVRRAAARTAAYIADEPVLAAGRVELLWYLHEQSISFDYHRYGNLGSRAIRSAQSTTGLASVKP